MKFDVSTATPVMPVTDSIAPPPAPMEINRQVLEVERRSVFAALMGRLLLRNA